MSELWELVYTTGKSLMLVGKGLIVIATVVVVTPLFFAESNIAKNLYAAGLVAATGLSIAIAGSFLREIAEKKIHRYRHRRKRR